VYLAWLDLRDFRCHESLEIRPDPAVNVFIGNNGSGKTSLLEAVGYLASLKSFRRAPDAALVRQGADAAVIRGEFGDGERTIRVEIEIPAEGRRRVLLNGKRPKNRAEVVASIPLVAFLPDDLDLVKRGPAYRREYVDDVAAALWPQAGVEQQEYERAVRQRNALLRREGRQADPTSLDVWDERLVRLGSAVVRRRIRSLELIGSRLEDLYAEMTAVVESFAWRYESASVGDGTGSVEQRLAEAVTLARSVDVERRVSTVGPHRDEIGFHLSGRDVRTRASQGEQRAVALSLRVAAYEVLRRERGATPLLVLDDVFSELDAERSRRLVGRLPDGQVFVSSAREDEVPVRGMRWTVSAGGIDRRE
jgi:DNA replication and repair protein RecF